MGIKDHRTTFWCMDYRDIPTRVGVRYNKISCIEMAEHVGVKNFQAFLTQVRELLQDDGVFLLQIAGLRRAFQVRRSCMRERVCQKQQCCHAQGFSGTSFLHA
jgi:cyclopropane fatty-acyl-phospholipid synthase-like methyltransferase